MRTTKRFLAFLLCAVMLAGTACADTTERITFSATSINLPDNVSFMEDDIYRTYDEKFNFAYDLINITWETWAERDRLWITSGDMPDMLFWDFNLKDYMSYAKQGLIKALP